MSDLRAEGLLDGAVAVEPFTAEDAGSAALLRPQTRDAGLSLGDRACVALGRRLEMPVLTGDAVWAELDLELEVRLFR